MAAINDLLSRIHSTLSTVGFNDILEMIIMAVLIYKLFVWVKTTRTWFLVKGIAAILVLVGVARVLELNTIIYLVSKSLDILVLALLIVFQPELRRMLEQLGRGKVLEKIFGKTLNKGEDELDEATVDELVDAAFALGRARTGALIVLEREVPLNDYIRTGIELDAVTTSQLLINIFEHNTPLHDGAVIIRGTRIVAATCYLPLSSSTSISKELGTRHRAGLGMSEATDSLTIIVSEETGNVSVASEGQLRQNIDAEELRATLMALLNEQGEDLLTKLIQPLKRRKANEAETD